MKRTCLPVVLVLAAMLALTACANRENGNIAGPADTGTRTEGAGGTMGM